jgi:3-hydroxyacyl-CoA dehydrogenase
MRNAKPPICVVGSGTMGRGIAQVALTAGHQVWFLGHARLVILPESVGNHGIQAH